MNDTQERLDVYTVLKQYADEKYKLRSISQEFKQLLCEIAGKKEKMPVWFSYRDRDVSFQDTGEDVIKTSSYYRLGEEDTYICSFCMNGDSLPMWNYYSKSRHNRGYSIGIACGNWCYEKLQNEGYTLRFYQVLYCDQQKYRVFDDVILKWDNIYRRAKEEDRKRIQDHLASRISDMQYIFKNKHFHHEQEVRAILQIPRDAQIPHSLKIQYRNSNGYIVAYIELKLPERVIMSVTASPLLEKEVDKSNVQEMLDSRGYHCNTYSSQVPIRF